MKNLIIIAFLTLFIFSCKDEEDICIEIQRPFHRIEFIPDTITQGEKISVEYIDTVYSCESFNRFRTIYNNSDIYINVVWCKFNDPDLACPTAIFERKIKGNIIFTKKGNFNLNVIHPRFENGTQINDTSFVKKIEIK